MSSIVSKSSAISSIAWADISYWRSRNLSRIRSRSLRDTGYLKLHPANHSKTYSQIYLDSSPKRTKPHPLQCERLVRSDRPPEPYQNTAIACSHSKSDRHTQGKGLIDGCDRCPDGGGKAIAQPRLKVTNPIIRTSSQESSPAKKCKLFKMIARLVIDGLRSIEGHRLTQLPPRSPGQYEGKFVVPDNFNDPLPDDVLEGFLNPADLH